MRRPELTMLIGPQASGKTTWIENNIRKEDYITLATDMFWPRVDGRRVWIDDEGEQRDWGLDPMPDHVKAKAWAWVMRRLTYSLSKSIDTILEGTFPKKKSRKKIIALANEFDYEIKCVYTYPTLAECAVRNENRVDRVPDIILAKTYGAFVEPIVEEGFYEVIKI